MRDTSTVKTKSRRQKLFEFAKELEKKEKKLKPDEIGCINCVRSRASQSCCDRCIAFSNFKNIEMLNSELREKGLGYLCVSSVRELNRQSSVEDEVLELISSLKNKRGR